MKRTMGAVLVLTALSFTAGPAAAQVWWDTGEGFEPPPPSRSAKRRPVPRTPADDYYGDPYGDAPYASPPRTRASRYAAYGNLDAGPSPDEMAFGVRPGSGRYAALPDQDIASGLDQEVPEIYRRQTVRYNGPHPAGTVVIDTKRKFLFLVQGDGTAIRYGIGVGREGFQWRGTQTVSMKREWPDWRPPKEMLKRRPDLPEHMPGGMDNPLGARALYLGSSLYRIHGTNEPSTIGHNVSSGCIRLTNDDVIDLYERVKVGARVIVS